MMDDIDAADFKAIKMECTEALRMLEAKITKMPNKAKSLKTIEGLLDIVILRYLNIQLHYKSANIIKKRKLIGSMYPKNLCFDGREYQTPHPSEPLTLILHINKQLRSIKKGE